MTRDGLVRIGLVLALWAAGLGAAAQFAKIGVVLPELAALNPEAGAAIGFLVSLIGLVGIAFGLVAGVFASRIGLRRLLVWSLALGAAVSLFQAMLPAFPVLLASRIVEGFSHLGIVVAAPVLIALAAGRRARATAMTLWGTFFGVAFAATALVGPPLIAWAGPGALFLAHAAWLAAMAVLLAWLLPRAADKGTASPGLALAELARRHVQAYASPRIAAPAIGWLFYTLTFVSLLTILPTLLPEAGRRVVATAAPLVSIVVAMTVGLVLLRWLSPVRIVMTGFAASGLVALGLIAWPPTPGSCIALFAALGLLQGSTFAAIPQLNTSAEDQALANGAVAQMGNLGNAIGTPLLLALLLGAGFAVMIGGVIALYALGLAAHALLARVRARTERMCQPMAQTP